MGAFIDLPFGIKVEIMWETGSGVAVCIHFVQKTTPTTVTVTDLNNAISCFEAWGQAITAIQTPIITRAGIRATDVSVPEGITTLFSPYSQINGQVTVAKAPSNVAITASHYTGLTGRSRHGRTFIPGVAYNGVLPGDVIVTPVRLNVTNAYIALRASLAPFGLVHTVASFRSNKLPRVHGLGTAISNTQVDQYSDSQRRRLTGRGA